MIALFIFWIIISNICHLVFYWGKGTRPFKESLKTWNILTLAFMLWIIVFRPSPETLEWLLTFIK